MDFGAAAVGGGQGAAGGGLDLMSWCVVKDSILVCKVYTMVRLFLLLLLQLLSSLIESSIFSVYFP
jgi:hypothetical protein